MSQLSASGGELQYVLILSTTSGLLSTLLQDLFILDEKMKGGTS